MREAKTRLDLNRSLGFKVAEGEKDDARGLRARARFRTGIKPKTNLI